MQLIHKNLAIFKSSNGKKRFDISKIITLVEMNGDDQSSEDNTDFESDHNVDEVIPIDPGPDFPDPGIFIHLIYSRTSQKACGFSSGRQRRALACGMHSKR